MAAILGSYSSHPAPSGHGTSIAGARHRANALDRVAAPKGRREDRRQEACSFDDEGGCLVSFQGGPGGIEHCAPVARNQGFHGGGEGRVPDQVGQVDHLTLKERSQSPVPPSVEGHEPQREADDTPRKGAFLDIRGSVP